MSVSDFEKNMQIALEEAKTSLKEGNHGFGAVIVKDNQIVARTHDREETDSDPTSHAEINAIRLATGEFGRDFSDCTLITTHEPCPMCAGAIIGSGIKTLVYGFSIAQAMAEGRSRINLNCRELFDRTGDMRGRDIQIYSGILEEQCAVLYRQDVRAEINKLRGVTQEKLTALSEELTSKRVAWYQKMKPVLRLDTGSLVEKGYGLLLQKLGIEPDEAPVILKDSHRIVFHSQNFCPTLEACRILDLDTRIICKHLNEGPTDMLMKQLDPRLGFGRNYLKLRPYCDYCEEMVTIKEE
jgi:tRNA(Arg) A34 adenosine deaminase TadA